MSMEATPASAPRRGRTAGIITAVGGALMTLGVFLPFAAVEAGNLPGAASQSVGGLDTADGKLFLGVGIALIVFGILMVLLTSTVAIRIFAVLSLLGAGFMLVAAIIDLGGLERQFAEGIAGQTGLPVDQIQATLEQFGAGITPGIGMYLVLAASVVGVIGAIMGLFARGAASDMKMVMPPPAAPPPPPPSEPGA